MSHPSSTADPFARETLLNPYPFYADLRRQGGAVWLETIGCYALSRYEDVREALRDWRTFSSAEGVALDPMLNSVMRGMTIGCDNPLHGERRKVIARPIGPAKIRELQARIVSEANMLIANLVSRGTVDAVQDLAWHLPLTIVSHFVGLPEEGRTQMLRWSEATANLAGPDYDAADESYRARKMHGFSIIGDMQAYLGRELQRDCLAPGSWGAMLYEAADRGEITPEDVPVMISDYLGPSLDTTISATGSLIWLLSQNPDQWQRLKEDRSLISRAAVEAVRLESPIQWFTRVLTRDHEIGGVPLPAGTRVLLLYGSANRDERKFPEADSFDVARNPADQIGWGHGVHACVGMHLSRMEMESLLAALLDQVERIESVAPPEQMESTSFRAFRHLPIALHA